MASGYDQHVLTYSREGRVFQVEYADKAVERAGTALGVRCTDGIVLAVEKVQKSPMVVKTSASNRRIVAVEDHVGMCVAGLLPDGRALVNYCRREAVGYRDNYGCEIPPHVLSQRLALYMHYFTIHGAWRPYGATALIAGFDADTGDHQLSMVQPNGETYRYFGVAVGKGKQAAQSEIEKTRLPTKTAREAVNEIARIFMVLREERNRDQPYEVEMTWLTAENGWTHQPVPEDVMAEAQQWAEKAIEDAEMADDSDDSEDD